MLKEQYYKLLETEYGIYSMPGTDLAMEYIKEIEPSVQKAIEMSLLLEYILETLTADRMLTKTEELCHKIRGAIHV